MIDLLDIIFLSFIFILSSKNVFESKHQKNFHIKTKKLKNRMLHIKTKAASYTRVKKKRNKGNEERSHA